MRYKTILALVPEPATAAPVLSCVVALAERFFAHVIGAHVRPRYEPYPGGAAAVNLELYARLQDDAKQVAEAARAAFDTALRLDAGRSEWREVAAYQSGISQKLSEIALRTDLVGVPGLGPDAGADAVGLIHDVLLSTGRPVLMLPPGMKPGAPLGRRALLCWTPTREASLAAQNALGFLADAALTTVLTIGHRAATSAEEATEGHALAQMLSRHGVATEVRHSLQEEPTIGAQIVKEAAISGTDLIVMGAFGHSRLHDLLFTDPTREVMRKAPVPVLFSG